MYGDVSVESFIFKLSGIEFINKMDIGSLVVLLAIFHTGTFYEKRKELTRPLNFTLHYIDEVILINRSSKIVDIKRSLKIFKLSGIDFIKKMELGSLIVLLSIFAKVFGFQIYWPMSVPGGSYSRNVVDIFKLLLISKNKRFNRYISIHLPTPQN
jgi:hypothetical protein